MPLWSPGKTIMDECNFAVHETKDASGHRGCPRNFFRDPLQQMILTVGTYKNVSGSKFWVSGELLNCRIYVYMWKGRHPHSGVREDRMLENWRISVSVLLNGEGSRSFYFTEEVLSTYEYRQLIKADDRLLCWTWWWDWMDIHLCSVLSEDLNGSDYCAVSWIPTRIMTIGYVARRVLTSGTLGKNIWRFPDIKIQHWNKRK